GDEAFKISAVASAGRVVGTFQGAHGTYTQTCDGVTRSVADAGDGNDRITVADNVTAEVELHGGDGDDTLQSGGGPATLLGGAGNDHLTAGSHAALLDGEAGDDALQGGAGADTLRGGDGNDNVAGGGGADQVEGG